MIGCTAASQQHHEQSLQLVVKVQPHVMHVSEQKGHECSLLYCGFIHYTDCSPYLNVVSLCTTHAVADSPCALGLPCLPAAYRHHCTRLPVCADPVMLTTFSLVCMLCLQSQVSSYCDSANCPISSDNHGLLLDIRRVCMHGKFCLSVSALWHTQTWERGHTRLIVGCVMSL